MEAQDQYLPAEQPKITKEEIDRFLYGSGTKLTEPQKVMFLEMARINNLNPFRREIYAIPYGDKFNIITGFEVYIKRAERSGKLAGWKADVEKEGNDLVGVCTIYRKDWNEPLTMRAWFSEYNQNNRMWKEKPRTMIRKVAIAQAFRMAFPEELGGMPYTADEMPAQDAEVINIIPKVVFDKTDLKNLEEAYVKDNFKQSAKVKKAIAWALEQGMTREEIESAVGDIDKINEDDLGGLKASYMAWKDGKQEKTSIRSVPEAKKAMERDELPGTHQIYCERAEGEKVSLEHCRTICSEFPSYRECPDYCK